MYTYVLLRNDFPPLLIGQLRMRTVFRSTRFSVFLYDLARLWFMIHSWKPQIVRGHSWYFTFRFNSLYRSDSMFSLFPLCCFKQKGKFMKNDVRWYWPQTPNSTYNDSIHPRITMATYGIHWSVIVQWSSIDFGIGLLLMFAQYCAPRT